jgi:hypothetical protein
MYYAIYRDLNDKGHTKEWKVISRPMRDYKSKQEFLETLRAQGWIVKNNKIYTSDEWDNL